ncbi:gliding motility protein [Streptomyces sp. NPDC089799]|uniref:gliding motility protein n=1 Tax=Streptomyces sp. NPDC089799 TaxID=3155066 RepID=UPI003440E5B0
MGVFSRFRRRKGEDGVPAGEAAPAAETDGAAESAAAEPAGEAAAAEGVEIPKQQSAAEAADSGTGEGART